MSSNYQYKVSVCVPVYNSAQYLPDCIDSLVTQTLKEIQLVLVDDGSTDKSPQILDSYAKKYDNILVIHQENQGLGGARNTGIAAAKGEYIGFVDSDDMVKPEMFKTLLDMAKSDKADIAISNLKIFPEGAKKNAWFTPYTGDVDAEFLHKNTQPWNKIVKKSLIDKIGFQFHRKNGDGMYILLMIAANKIVSTNEQLYLYRAGHTSMSTDYKLENFLISIESCERQIAELSKISPDKNLASFFEFRMIHILLQTIAVAASKDDRGAFLKYKHKLKELNYRKNKYTKLILQKEFSPIKYLGIVHVLPLNFGISKIISRKML